MRRMAWQQQARCREYDPDLFFAVGARAERRAKTICGRCDVRQECLAFAIASKTDFGVWGGLSGKERRRVEHPAASRPWPALSPAPAAAAL